MTFPLTSRPSDGRTWRRSAPFEVGGENRSIRLSLVPNPSHLEAVGLAAADSFERVRSFAARPGTPPVSFQVFHTPVTMMTMPVWTAAAVLFPTIWPWPWGSVA